MERWKLVIRGKVQGVWYRANCREKGIELELSGFVRNEGDGSVYAEGQGTPQALNEWKKWCEQGPALARVVQVEFDVLPCIKEEGFHILR